MRIVALTLSLLVLAVTGAAAAKTPRPTLRVSTSGPLVVQGKAFRPHEKVKLLVVTDKPRRAVVRTGSLGGFRYVFSFRVPTCSSVSIQAIGVYGSRASFSLDQPDCAPIPG